MDIVPLELCNMGSVPWCLALSSIPMSAIGDIHVGDPQENWELSCFHNSFDDLVLGAVISAHFMSSYNFLSKMQVCREHNGVL